MKTGLYRRRLAAQESPVDLNYLNSLCELNGLAERRSVNIPPEQGVIYPVEHGVVVRENNLAVSGARRNTEPDVGIEIVERQFAGEYRSHDMGGHEQVVDRHTRVA